MKQWPHSRGNVGEYSLHGAFRYDMYTEIMHIMSISSAPLVDQTSEETAASLGRLKPFSFAAREFGKQGPAIWHQPKRCTITTKIPENYHIFPIVWYPPQMGPMLWPLENPFEKKTSRKLRQKDFDQHIVRPIQGKSNLNQHHHFYYQTSSLKRKNLPNI